MAQNLLINENGTTALEYAVLIAFIILGCMIAIQTFGIAVSNWYTGVTPTVSSLQTAP